MSPTLTSGHALGPYLIQTILATGTFGTVYRAIHRETAVSVVIHVFAPPEDGLLPSRDLFALGQYLLTLRHPAILPIWEVHFRHDPPYLVMQHAQGGTLGQRLALAFPAPLPWSQAIPIIRHLGEALHCLHTQQIVHTHVQPSCILLDAQDHALLSGFDRARREGHTTAWQPIHLTPYTAPEQPQGRCTPNGDLYALGRIASQLVTGATPHQQSPAHLVYLVSSGQIPPPLGRAILRAIAEEPEHRWPSVAAFLAAWESSE